MTQIMAVPNYGTLLQSILELCQIPEYIALKGGKIPKVSLICAQKFIFIYIKLFSKIISFIFPFKPPNSWWKIFAVSNQNYQVNQTRVPTLAKKMKSDIKWLSHYIVIQKTAIKIKKVILYSVVPNLGNVLKVGNLKKK